MLHTAVSKNRKFSFMYYMWLAFLDLEEKLITPPLLTFPNFEAPFKVETDASSVEGGAVLPQQQEDRKFHLAHVASPMIISGYKTLKKP